MILLRAFLCTCVNSLNGAQLRVCMLGESANDNVLRKYLEFDSLNSYSILYTYCTSLRRYRIKVYLM